MSNFFIFEEDEVEATPIPRQRYIMRVCNRLLIKLKACGISPTEATVFFGSQIEPMLACKPNFGPSSNKSKTNLSIKNDIRIMRGYFPNTPQMFKVYISDNHPYSGKYAYYVKVSEPVVRIPTKPNERGLSFTSRYESSFDSSVIEEQLNKRLENEVLGQEHSIDKLINDKVAFSPKCISPKGMPIYKLNYSKG